MQNKNILEELYYGNITPCDKCYSRDSEYAKCMKIISDHDEKLTAFLHENSNREAQDLFSQLMSTQDEVLCMGEQERFIEGFRLGARFMLDTFLVSGKRALKDIC